MRSTSSFVAAVAAAFLALGANGCAQADETSDGAPAKPVHVWPSAKPDSGASNEDAGVDAGPEYLAFESPDAGGTTGTGSGTGTGTGTGTGSGADACGICDRAWQCDADDDMWTSSGSTACVNSRTGTTLNCDGTMLHGGTWSGSASEIILAFPDFGGSYDVTCTPGE